MISRLPLRSAAVALVVLSAAPLHARLAAQSARTTPPAAARAGDSSRPATKPAVKPAAPAAKAPAAPPAAAPAPKRAPRARPGAPLPPPTRSAAAASRSRSATAGTARRARAASAASKAASTASAKRVEDAPAPEAPPAPEMITVRGTVRGEDIVRTARRYLGVRYVLGGTTPKAFDCSGYVRYVFAQHGIHLPRTAKEQAGVGDAPFPGDLQPGDLLFFYGGLGAQHIAFYVGGDTIIHASSSGKKVRLDVLSRPGRRGWFRERLIAVRRVLPAEGVFQIPAGSVSARPASAPGQAPTVQAAPAAGTPVTATATASSSER